MRKKFQSMLLLIVVVTMMTGCNLNPKDRAYLLQEAIRHFGVAIRWSEFDFARSMLAPRDGKVKPQNPKLLSEIRVTGWTAGQPVMHPEGIEATVKVSFDFYHEDSGRVVTLQHHQVWWFNEAAAKWMLDGSLPDFDNAWQKAH